MNIILFLVFVAIAIIASRFWLKRIKDEISQRNNYNSKLDSWMAMRREKRNFFEEKEKKNSMQRKKILLKQIRKEYNDLIQTKKSYELSTLFLVKTSE